LLGGYQFAYDEEVKDAMHTWFHVQPKKKNHSLQMAPGSSWTKVTNV